MTTNVQSWTRGGAQTERWRKPLVASKTWIPIDFLLAWADIEAGGQPESTTSLGERGLSQVHPNGTDGSDGEQALLGLNDEDFARLSTDYAFSLQTLIKHAQLYALQAKRVLADVGVEWHGRDFWKLVKLFHGAFAMPKYSIQAFKAYMGRAPRSWDELMGFATLSHALNTDWKTGNAKLETTLHNLIPSVFNNAQETGEASQLPFYDPAQAQQISGLLREYNLMQ